MKGDFFSLKDIEKSGAAWIKALVSAYGQKHPFPASSSSIRDIPAIGKGMDGLPDLWDTIVNHSTHLATPWMSGHMDTAPHPVAAMTAGLVAALNNNMLFRELSPLASDAEEAVIDFFIRRLGLDENWNGTFASGGSIANLTALFSAVGGFDSVADRGNVHLLIPASGHLSLSKSANVLGIGNDHIHKITCDDGGRMHPEALTEALKNLPGGAKPIVVCVLGTTIHGSLDNLLDIGKACANHAAWLHVDLIYGAGLAFSHEHRRALAGLDGAHSIVLGPQKWMYVPRVSAIVLVRGREYFNRTLGTDLPYSLNGAEHRGKWGLQGSRPADGLVLWSLLQIIGTDALGSQIDRSIALTKTFHRALLDSDRLDPTHTPDLNLQTFRVDDRDDDGARLTALHKRLTENGRSWFSLSRWNGEHLMRAVLLSPYLGETHIEGFIQDLEQAAT